MIVQKTCLIVPVLICSLLFASTATTLTGLHFAMTTLMTLVNEMAGIYSAILFTITRTSKICLFCEPINRWNECKFDVELCWILSGEDRNFAILQLYWSETYSI